MFGALVRIERHIREPDAAEGVSGHHEGSDGVLEAPRQDGRGRGSPVVDSRGHLCIMRSVNAERQRGHAVQAGNLLSCKG